MTITEHASYSTTFDVSLIESHGDPLDVRPAEPVVAAAAVADIAAPPRRSWRQWLATGEGGRRYHHPRRERFVEEAAMSREMFKL
jgi:hypothetical protein